MKVVYLGRASQRVPPAPAAEGDVIELLANNWDDFGYRTTFQTVCRIDGKLVQLDSIRLLIDGSENTESYLDNRRAQGWNGEFPIPKTDYLSVPSEITFYEQLEGLLAPGEALRVALALRDASYLVHIALDQDAQDLIETAGFTKSLQRERGSIKAFVDGWKVLERQAIAVLDLGFKFRDVFDELSTLNVKFQPTGILPRDINVLIGANGAGKSRVLHQMVEDWISPDDSDAVGFTGKPNLSQLVVISYSPFERFAVDLKDKGLQDSEAYRYFGFRGRGANGKIRLSHEFPKRNAAHALIACVADDTKYGAIKGWARKVQTVERVLRTAFEFDLAAVSVDATVLPDSDYGIDHDDGFYFDEDDSHRYVWISPDRVGLLNVPDLQRHLQADSGVHFFRGGERIELSSGQRLFAYIVINIIGAIRRNSLVLIDEPELFLHPTLEVQFIEMLKEILSSFNSKALLATHSLVTVREIPASCVHVFERATDRLVIKQPPFQTFGGDVQRISSYVFGDRSVSKPFERWISDKIEELGSAEELIAQLGDEINEELIIQIKAMGSSQW